MELFENFIEILLISLQCHCVSIIKEFLREFFFYSELNELFIEFAEKNSSFFAHNTIVANFYNN